MLEALDAGIPPSELGGSIEAEQPLDFGDDGINIPPSELGGSIEATSCVPLPAFDTIIPPSELGGSIEARRPRTCPPTAAHHSAE